MRKLSLLLLVALLALAIVPAQAQTVPQGTITLMVYMCGADLESDAAHASDDLQEMIAAGVPQESGVRVLVETGGSQRWSMAGVSGEGNQRHLITEDGLQTVQADLGRRNMGQAETLADFLAYGISHYPADRYGLVLWNHGSGPLLGVCFDPLFGGDSLTLTELSDALDSGLPTGTRLDWIAFDACLMSAVETAAALSPYADFMIASQDLVAGVGLDYAAWMGALAQTPAMPAESLACLMAETYIADTARAGYAGNATMAVVDLSRVDPLLDALDGFGGALTRLTERGLYKNITRAREGVRAFGAFADGVAAGLVDVRSLCDAFAVLAPVESGRLADALGQAVVYSAASTGAASGISLYFPTSGTAAPYGLDSAHAALVEQSQYTSFVRSLCAQDAQSFEFETYTPENLYSNFAGQREADGAFVDLWEQMYGQSAGGFIGFVGSAWGVLPEEPAAGSGTGVWADLPAAATEQALRVEALWGAIAQTGDAYYDAAHSNSNLWGNPAAVAPAENIARVAKTYFTTSRQALQSVYAIQLTRDALDHLRGAQGVLLKADGDGYALLGELGVTQVDWKTGMVYSLFDGTWPLLDGHMAHVQAFPLSDGRTQVYVPVRVDGQDGYLSAIFAEGATEARVLGMTTGYDENGAAQRGLSPLPAGASVTLLFERVHADGHRAGMAEGETLTVPENGLTLGYGRIDAGDYQYGFSLENIYGHRQLGELVTLTF